MICNKCQKNEVPTYRKTKCDECAKADEAAWNAKQGEQLTGQVQAPVTQPVPANPPVQKIPATGNELVPETGNFQSTVWTHSVRPHSYEIGKPSETTARTKLYFETPSELKAMIQDMRDAGLMDLPLDELPMSDTGRD